MDIRQSMVLATIFGAAMAGAIGASCKEETGAGANGAGNGSGTGATGTGGSILFGGSGGDGAGVVSDAGPDGDADVCASTTVAAEAKAAVMLFLVDRTGSMNCNPPPEQLSSDCAITPVKEHAELPSKWEITRNALLEAFGVGGGGLETAVPLPSVGVAYFNNDQYCGFPSVPSVDIVTLSGDYLSDPQLAALQTSLGGVVPKGDTPIVGTLMSAYAYLHDNAGAFPASNRFVVLLTDGAETCDPGYASDLVLKAAEANWVGIRTFVLGAPGSEGARSFLSQIAYNGGTPSSPTCIHDPASPDDVGDCHMDMTLSPNFAAELAANLQAISTQALTCQFDVPVPALGDPPVDLTKVNVLYSSAGGTPEYILQNNALPCDDPNNNGWQYTDGNTVIELCAGACATIKNDPQASVSIELGCQTHEVPR
jgi:hypothetical protein